jgi:hypothetical protein
LREGGFNGAIHLVNPHYDEIEGIRSVKSLDDLPAAPDLVVIAVPRWRYPPSLRRRAQKVPLPQLSSPPDLVMDPARSLKSVRRLRKRRAFGWSARTALGSWCRGRPWNDLPQPALVASSLVALAVAMVVPFTPAGRWFGFEAPPLGMLGGIGFLVLLYLVCAELLKRVAVAPSAASSRR